MVQWLRAWHWNQTDVDSIPTYLLTSCMTLGKLLNLPKLQFLHLKLGLIMPHITICLKTKKK